MLPWIVKLVKKPEGAKPEGHPEVKPPAPAGPSVASILAMRAMKR